MTERVPDDLFGLLLLAFPPDEFSDYRNMPINTADQNANDVMILDWVIAAIVQSMAKDARATTTPATK